VVTVTAILINELREMGLLNGIEPHLTDKGREWMHQLEDLDDHEASEDWAADLVLSVNAISR
jgi:hypothetical protein